MHFARGPVIPCVIEAVPVSHWVTEVTSLVFVTMMPQKMMYHSMSVQQGGCNLLIPYRAPPAAACRTLRQCSLWPWGMSTSGVIGQILCVTVCAGGRLILCFKWLYYKILSPGFGSLPLVLSLTTHFGCVVFAARFASSSGGKLEQITPPHTYTPTHTPTHTSTHTTCSPLPSPPPLIYLPCIVFWQDLCNCSVLCIRNSMGQGSHPSASALESRFLLFKQI